MFLIDDRLGKTPYLTLKILSKARGMDARRVMMNTRNHERDENNHPFLR
jgi:hypothetical protein